MELQHKIEHIISRIDNLQLYAIKNLRWYHWRLRKSVEGLNTVRNDLRLLQSKLAEKING